VPMIGWFPTEEFVYASTAAFDRLPDPCPLPAG